MMVKSGKSYVYKVKIDKSKHLFDPHKGDKIDSKNNHTKDLRFKFISVSEKCFNSYLQYLKDGYDSNLVVAEREI